MAVLKLSATATAHANLSLRSLWATGVLREQPLLAMRTRPRLPAGFVRDRLTRTCRRQPVAFTAPACSRTALPTVQQLPRHQRVQLGGERAGPQPAVSFLSS